MRIKKNILAPVVLTLGSLSVIAGTVAPIVASSAGSVAVASGASANSTPRMG